MTVRVYHLDSRATDQQRVGVMFGECDISGLWAQGVYTLVAEVATDSADMAFRATNSLDTGWWRWNANGSPVKVQALFPGTDCRSTSVGDVVATPEGYYVCARMGWERLSLTPQQAPLPPAGERLPLSPGDVHLTPLRGEISLCGARGLTNSTEITLVDCPECQRLHEALTAPPQVSPQEFCAALKALRPTVIGCKLSEEGTVRVRDRNLLWVQLPMLPCLDDVPAAAKMLASADVEMAEDDAEIGA